MKGTKFSRLYWIVLIVTLLGISAGYSMPPVRERMDWSINELRARVKYAISPPENVVFVPNEASKLSTPAILLPSPSIPAPSSTPAATEIISAPPTRTATPLSERVNLTGFKHEYQTWNNCGPATLAMALSF